MKLSFSLGCLGGALALLIASCSSGGAIDDTTSEGVGAVSEGLSKCKGGTLGDSNYCSAACPCAHGEGDCDYASDCVAGMFCAGKGAYFYGIPNNACAPQHCANKVMDGDETMVDCGGSCGSLCPNECDLVTGNGTTGHCTAGCPCPNGEGDCSATNARCVSGFCKPNVGAEFGLGASVDICLAATCNNLAQDAGETGVDCGGSCNACPAGDIQSARFGGATRDHGFGISYDAAGNFVIAGRFSTTANFGGTDLTSAGGSDIYVAKYNSLGAHQWSKSFGSTGPDGDLSVDVGTDSSGNVIVVGNFYNTVNFGGGGLTAAGTSDMFVVKLSSAGNHVWSKRFGGAGGATRANTVAVKGTGEAYVGGGFQGTVTFGSQTKTSLGGYDAVLLKIASTGSVSLVRNFGAADDDDLIQGTAVDSTGDIYVVGSYAGSVDFGTGTPLVSTPGTFDAFTLKMTSAGTTVWNKSLGGGGSDVAFAVAVDSARQPTVVGRFRQTVDLGSGSAVTAAGASDVFAVAYDTNGGYRWSNNFGSTVEDRARGVAIDAAGNAIVVGEFRGSVDFGAGTKTANGTQTAAFLVKYSSAGAFMSGQAYGTAGAATAGDVAAITGKVNFTGEFSGTASFGGADLTSLGMLDMFWAKIPN